MKFAAFDCQLTLEENSWSNSYKIIIQINSNLDEILNIYVNIGSTKMVDHILETSESEFNEFEPRLKSTKTGFNWAPG